VSGPMCFEPKWDGYRLIAFREGDRTILWSRPGKDLTRCSVGVKSRRADVWPGESAVISARQVSLSCLSMSTSFRTTRTPQHHASARHATIFEPSRNYVRGLAILVAR
jgi:ATP-dependent DNA ligase